MSRRTVTRFRGPAVPPNERPYQPPYQYQCSGGHDLGSDTAVRRCPLYVNGAPCPGILTRVGKGAFSPEDVR